MLMAATDKKISLYKYNKNKQAVEKSKKKKKRTKGKKTEDKKEADPRSIQLISRKNIIIKFR